MNYIDIKNNILNKLEHDLVIDNSFNYLTKVSLTEFENKDTNNLVFNLFIKEEFDNLKKILQYELLELAKKEGIKNLKLEEDNLLENIRIELNSFLKELDDSQIEPLGLKAETKKGNLGSEEYRPEIRILNKNNEDIIKNISNGQRNMVAFIFYIIELQKLNKQCIRNNKELVAILDDIVDGSDFYSYFIMKHIIIKYIGNDKINIKMILLTHNFNFANIYLQDTENKNFLDMYYFTDKFSIEKIDQEIFNMPDNLLFLKLTDFLLKKEGVEKLICFISWATIFLKIIEAKFIELYHSKEKKYFPFNQEPFSVLKKTLSKNTIYFKAFNEFESSRKALHKYINDDIKDVDTITKVFNELLKKMIKIDFIKIDIREFENIFKIKLENNCIDNIFEFEFEEDENFIIKNSWNATRVMLFSKKNNNNRTKEKKIEHYVSNYLRHSPNAVSSPIIALNHKKVIHKL